MFRTRLEVKILLLLAGVLVAAFGVYLIITIQSETDTLLGQFREKSRVYTQTLMTGIRNVMLTGKGSFARSLVNEARETGIGALHIYDRDGREVFRREGEGIGERGENPFVKQVFETASPVMDDHDGGRKTVTRYEPLFNLSDCQSCHGKDHLIRGVMQLSLEPTLSEDGGIEKMEETMAEMVGTALASGFRTIMLAGQGKLIETLVVQTKEVPAVQKFQVYNRFGRIRFGDSVNVFAARTILDAIRRQEPHTVRTNPSQVTRFIPLRNEERCQLCHLEDHDWRGVLAVTLNTQAIRQRKEDPATVISVNFQRMLTAAFRSIMLVGKGGYVRQFIDEIRSGPAVKELRVFDRDGRVRFMTEQPKNRPVVTELLREPKHLEFYESDRGEEHLVMMTPLLNDAECQKCHGPHHPVRAIVEVSSSMAPLNSAIQQNTIRTVAVGTITLLFVALLLHQFMKTVVVKPINVIGNVASRVGEGDLSVRAEVLSKDEIGQLAQRINEMIKGLRERFHLEKFVSRQAVEAIKSASGKDTHGLKLGGERLTVAVLFSDIRGFTSFSEKVEPETVVHMLNECLSQQTRIVKKYGGDIDKFVGDEMVAVFLGDGMVDRAVQCALEIQKTVGNKSSVQEATIRCGIGINAGPVIMGAMGSEERMDFTVIGDTVNLGARLCGAAVGGQILISGNAAALLQPQKFSLTPLEPMRVKGKKRVVEVFEVGRHEA
jgi:class 3 adenylate cyclase